ncbi:RNA polymerase sigma factor [Dactylosporangium sp. CS-033363]|uniref:RNA polymerase sigma factor n=1 Tax=Dactylosporangium sp. CS-033363 TaxID=3239935 RepID=UPI003D92A2E8
MTLDSDARRGEQWHNALHGQYWKMVFRFLVSEVGPDDAHDVAQQTFLVAWKKRDHVPDDPKTWLLNVARKDALKHRRWRLRHPEDLGSDAMDELPLPADGTEAVASHRDELQRVWRQLRPTEQRVLALAYLEDLTGEQLGEALGVRATTARQRLSRATKRARDLLNRTTGTGDPNGC